MIRSLTLYILLCFTAVAQNMKMLPFPEIIVEQQIQKIRIITQAEFELGDLPDHPKITWLGYSSVRLPNNAQKQIQTENRIEFVVTSPGLLEFPPIPVVLENKEFFVRLDNVRVIKNKASKNDTRFEVFWNDQIDIPKQVHHGEAIEIKFIGLIKKNQQAHSRLFHFTPPSNRVLGGHWHPFSREESRKPHPSDYFLSSRSEIFSNSGQRNPFFFRRNAYDARDTYRENELQIDGITYLARSYQSRLFFSKLGESSGHFSMTIGTSKDQARTHVLPFKIEVLPIPPLPNDQAIDTGLVGNWQIESQILPPEIQVAKPFTINIAMSGHGNPDLRNVIDLSTNGFPSVNTEFESRVGHNYKIWKGLFQQTLLPTGKIGTLPAITFASFDTAEDQWRYHKVTPEITLPGFNHISSVFTPRPDLGPTIIRPVLLNLPNTAFAAFALAPFLPFLFGFLKKRYDARDPEAQERQRLLKKLIHDFRSGKGTPDEIDSTLLPILRSHLKLPTGATTREVAEAISDPELSASLSAHAESSFSSTAAPINLKNLAEQLAKISLIIILSLSNLSALTLAEANAFHQEGNYSQAITSYRTLINDDPNRASLYLNLAQTHLAAGEPAPARAACHTALLLNPLDKEAHQLMSSIRERMGDLTVSRNRFLSLRPDQWILVSCVIWVLAFLYFAIRKVRSFPLWPGLALLALSLLSLGTAAWRQSHEYAPEQYMVLAEELPREPTAGKPDWNFPAFRAGQIVQVAEIHDTHARILTSDDSFWLPIRKLQQVW